MCCTVCLQGFAKVKLQSVSAMSAFTRPVTKGSSGTTGGFTVVAEREGQLRMRGKVNWYNESKGFGMITPAGDSNMPDVFVHMVRHAFHPLLI